MSTSVVPGSIRVVRETCREPFTSRHQAGVMITWCELAGWTVQHHQPPLPSDDPEVMIVARISHPATRIEYGTVTVQRGPDEDRPIGMVVFL